LAYKIIAQWLYRIFGGLWLEPQTATLLPLGSTATEALLVGRLKSVTVVSEAGFVHLGAAAATPADVRKNKANSEKIVTLLFLNIVIMNASYEKCGCR
jgi:hypothetical protein